VATELLREEAQEQARREAKKQQRRKGKAKGTAAAKAAGEQPDACLRLHALHCSIFGNLAGQAMSPERAAEWVLKQGMRAI
jgi:flagellar biosynthesis/type III secretory pathway protein FliH